MHEYILLYIYAWIMPSCSILHIYTALVNWGITGHIGAWDTRHYMYISDISTLVCCISATLFIATYVAIHYITQRCYNNVAGTDSHTIVVTIPEELGWLAIIIRQMS